MISPSAERVLNKLTPLQCKDSNRLRSHGAATLRNNGQSVYSRG